ncbi:Unknown protein [Striga hermonthica]|uniref:DUF4283 domain-containing protein n=1 Tax=Striga hermonthica TaxID=68872 RepID=A0A9N7R1C0_STRHE|nr:Unknown protein [Striga hermonthica]
MADNLVNQLQSFMQSEREEGGISIIDDDTSAGIQECSQSLFGRIYGEKRVNFTSMRNTLQTVWQTQKPVTARALGHNHFKFIFQTEEDKKRVLTSTWSFDVQYLLLKEWNPTEEVEEIESNPPKGREVRLVSSETEAKNQALTQGNKSAEIGKCGSESHVAVSLGIVVTNNMDSRKEQAVDLMCLDNLVQVPV